jgi:hypothetical protein
MLHPSESKSETEGPERAEIDLRAGERPAATDEAISILRQTGGLYERSGELVRIVGSQILPVDECWLTDYLARHIRFFRHKASDGDEPSRRETDPPAWLAPDHPRQTGRARPSRSDRHHHRADLASRWLAA